MWNAKPDCSIMAQEGKPLLKTIEVLIQWTFKQKQWSSLHVESKFEEITKLNTLAASKCWNQTLDTLKQTYNKVINQNRKFSIGRNIIGKNSCQSAWWLRSDKP